MKGSAGGLWKVHGLGTIDANFGWMCPKESIAKCDMKTFQQQYCHWKCQKEVLPRQNQYPLDS